MNIKFERIGKSEYQIVNRDNSEIIGFLFRGDEIDGQRAWYSRPNCDLFGYANDVYEIGNAAPRFEQLKSMVRAAISRRERELAERPAVEPEPDRPAMTTEFYDVTSAVAEFRAAGRDDLAAKWLDKAGTMSLRWCGFTIFRPLLALPAATADPAEQQRTIGDAIDRRAEALGYDYGALRVDRRMRWLMAESSEIIARRWECDTIALRAGEITTAEYLAA